MVINNHLENGPDARRLEFKIRIWEKIDDGKKTFEVGDDDTRRKDDDGARHAYGHDSPYVEKDDNGHDQEDDKDDEGNPSPSRSPSPEGYTSYSYTISSDSETSSSEEDLISSDEDAESRPPPNPAPAASPPPPILHHAKLPVSVENESLSFSIEISKGAAGTSATDQSSAEDFIKDRSDDAATPSPSSCMVLEGPIDILSASQVQVDGRWKLQVRTLQGPQNQLIAPHITVRWYHLHGAHQDFFRFMETCMSKASTVSARMKVLVAETLAKVKERMQPFSEGLYIEPGFVMRGDDKSGNETESVIFSCIPYFDIRAPSKAASPNGTSFPRRTLMQMRYPHLPVRDRDLEQTIRKFKVGPQRKKDKIVHVPTLWLMNIGSGLFVTCAHSPLSHEFNAPLDVFRTNLDFVDLSHPVSGSEAKDDLRKIRLRDWYGRPLLYTIAECQTYFHLEQKLRELKWGTAHAQRENPVELVYYEGQGVRTLYPYLWPTLIGDQSRIFIDVWPKELKDTAELEENVHNLGPDGATATADAHNRRKTLLPFFRWPSGSTKDGADEGASTLDENTAPFAKVNLPDIKRSKYRLMKVARSVMHEVRGLDMKDTGPSSRSFDDMAEDHSLGVQRRLAYLVRAMHRFPTASAKRSPHSLIVEEQSKGLVKESESILEALRETLKLFLDDVDEDAMLGKIWGVMMDLLSSMETIIDQVKLTTEPTDSSDPDWTSPITKSRVWTVRWSPNVETQPSDPKQSTSEGNAQKDIADRIRRCRKCRANHVYTDFQAVLKHLRKHAQAVAESRTPVSVVDSSLEDFIRNYDQALVEERNAAVLKIMQQSSKDSQDILALLQEIQDGVKTENGEMIDAYAFPGELVKTLRKLLVFFLEVEKAIRSTSAVSAGNDRPAFMRVEFALSYLKDQCTNVRVSIQAARKDLCSMVSSHGSYRINERVSLSAPYICAWLMRRLLVGAFDQKLTVSEMYGEYLRTVQLQVSQQPNKRLLRSINLVREDLIALGRVNAAQHKVVSSYGAVLDDTAYTHLDNNRKGAWPYEREILNSCLDHLADMRDDITNLIRQCPRLAETTKAFAEINEEDHGKAIQIFTVVTVIFLPLSFVTSYFGMNTSDIRDMGSSQSLYWIVAVPLTAVVIGTCLFLASNGDEIRSHIQALFNRLAGKEGENVDADGISNYRRNQILGFLKNSGSEPASVQYGSPAEEAEYVPVRQEDLLQRPQPQIQPKKYLSPTSRFTIEEKLEKLELVPSRDRRTSRRYGGYEEEGLKANPTQYDAPRPGYDPDIPTITKIPRKALEPESLAALNMPWEYDDQDRDYYLIPRDLREYERDRLFAHTRQLREDARRRERSGRTRERRAERKTRFDDEDPYPSRRGYTFPDRDRDTRERRSRRIRDEDTMGGDEDTRDRDRDRDTRDNRRSRRTRRKRGVSPGVNTEWLRTLGREEPSDYGYRGPRREGPTIRRSSGYGKILEEEDEWKWYQ